MFYEHCSYAIRAWVYNKLGVEFDSDGQFTPAGECTLVAHSYDLTDYYGVYIWRMLEHTVVSVPQNLMDEIGVAMGRQLLPGRSVSALIEPEFWQAALGKRALRIIGPAYQGFLDMGNFQPADSQGARMLTPADQPALRAFAAACPPNDWEDSAIMFNHEPIMGLERDGALVALASAPYQRYDAAVVCSVGVVTLPAARGSGAGLAVVSALAEHCLAKGGTFHYQTLRANLPSVAIARRLGFADVATSLAVRLTAP